MNRIIAILFLQFPSIIWAQYSCWHEVNLEEEIDIQSMQVDSLGFLWMAEKHNLYRFDGKDLVIKLQLDDESISTFTYSNNKIIVGTSYGRILKLEIDSEVYAVLQDTILHEPVTRILYVDDGYYVTASYESGIRVRNNDLQKKMDVDHGLVSNEVYDLALYNDKYYLATDQGIQVLGISDSDFALEVINTEDGLSDIVTTNLISHGDKIWYTDYDSHLGSIDLDHNIVNYTFDGKSKINNVISHNDEIYLVTDDGLKTFSDGRFIQQYPIKGKEKISIIQNDNEGNLWMVNGNGILLKANLYFQRIDIQSKNITAFAKFGDYYMIGNGNGLSSYKSNNERIVNSNNITHLVNFKNFLIVGTFSKGIMIYDRELNLVQHIKEWGSYKDQSVLHIHVSDNRLYVSSLTGVVEFELINDKLKITRNFDDLIGPGYIYSIMENADHMYFGTDRKGLIVLDKKSNEVTEYRKFSSGDKVGSIYALAQNNGKVWVTSENQGLGYFENDKLVSVNNIKNTSDKYTSLSMTNSGFLLAVRESSIDLIDPRSNHIMYYDKELDLKEEKTYLNTIHTEGDHTYFAHGSTVYRYSAKDNIKIHPNVVIDEVLVNLTPVTNEQSFDEDDNNIEFSFSGSWLTDPLKLTYEYILEGYDKDWRATKDKSISFRNLPPGNYNFRVRASENGYFLDEPEDTFSFEIKSHFYNLWWVRSLLALLLGLVAWSAIKAIEGRKKEKLALEKLNIENQFINLKNQLNPHFLFNAFNTLIGLIEEDSDRSVAFVERMTDFYRNMLEHGKQNLITLAQEHEMLNQYIAILKARFNGQLDIQLDINDNTTEYELPPMTLQLLLENAVKHNVVSSKKPLRFSIEQVKDKVTIRNVKTALVQDVQSTKTGLENIKRRFDLVGLPKPIIKNTEDSFEVIIHLKKNKDI